jgi:hypothetical protein
MARETDKKNKKLLQTVSDYIHVKYNEYAENSIFVEVYQVTNGKQHYQRWVNDETCKVVIFGNDKIQYYFKPEVLKHLTKQHAKLNLIKKASTNAYGFVLKGNQLKKHSSMII